MQTNEEFSLELKSLDQTQEERQAEELYLTERTGLSLETLCAAIETVIFMSDKPVGVERIRDLIEKDISLRLIHESVTRLQEEYEKSHHGIRLQEVADGYQFRTKATYTKYIRDLFKVSTLQLTPATLEVLAIIAYKQPISKSEIEKMRGVDSSHLVRTLLDKKLVKILGRSEEELGAPTVYATTAEFLDVFNLKNLNDLPPEYDLQDLIQKNVVGDAMSLKEIVGRSKKNKFFFDELDELDEIQKTVKAIATETEFTRTLKEENKKKMSEEEQPTEPRSAFDVMEDFVNKAQAESLEAELNAVQEDMEKLNSAFHAEEEQAVEISSEEANEDWTAEESPFKKSENDATEEKLLN